MDNLQRCSIYSKLMDFPLGIIFTSSMEITWIEDNAAYKYSPHYSYLSFIALEIMRRTIFTRESG